MVPSSLGGPMHDVDWRYRLRAGIYAFAIVFGLGALGGSAALIGWGEDPDPADVTHPLTWVVLFIISVLSAGFLVVPWGRRRGGSR